VPWWWRSADAEERFDMIWTTYPIATAHGSACQQQRAVVAVSRSMTQDGYPEDAATWRSFRGSVRTLAAAPARVTTGAARTYASGSRSAKRNRSHREGLTNKPSPLRTDKESDSLGPARITLVHSESSTRRAGSDTAVPGPAALKAKGR
jgi:hypothetical protein